MKSPESFARVLKASRFTHGSDRIIAGDLAGESWAEIPVIGRGEAAVQPYGPHIELTFKLADEAIGQRLPFYPEHIFWIGGASEGRLLLRVALHRRGEYLKVAFRHERNARSQMMRPTLFTTDPDLREARDVASTHRQQFLFGWDAYAVHLQAMLPESYKLLDKMRAELAGAQ